ncbi:MAG: antibiotic biosynthesis monooxygenase [Acidimicrobiaceae bacterium]|nr:antibiotic biosynthesis monooxygenase [Acidimicrobiaceae bacterium]
MITVIARWVADEGRGEELETLLSQVAVASRAEKGCVSYQPLRHIENGNAFAIYEQYVDEAAFEDHRNSSHFQETVIAKVLPLLNERYVDVYRNI